MLPQNQGFLFGLIFYFEIISNLQKIYMSSAKVPLDPSPRIPWYLIICHFLYYSLYLLKKKKNSESFESIL